MTILVIVADTQGNQQTTGLSTDVQLILAGSNTTPLQTIWFSATNVTCADLNIPVGYYTIPTNVSLNVYKRITTLTFQTLPANLVVSRTYTLHHNIKPSITLLLAYQTKSRTYGILSGDIETNPGPRPPNDPCVMCNNGVKVGIKCDIYDLWYHRACLNLTADELNIQRSSDTD